MTDLHERDGATAIEGAADQSSIARLTFEMGELRESLSLRGREIDSLQVELASKRAPFYRQPAVIVAVLALLTSILATFLTYQSSRTQLELTQNDQMIQQRARLTALIQSVAEWTTSYQNASAEENFYVDSARPQLDEANHFVGLLQSTPLRSLPLEKVILSNGYNIANEPGIALRLAQAAEFEAQYSSPLERAAAAKLVGVNAFESGDPAGGRQGYERGLAYLRSAPGYDPFIIIQTRLELLNSWSYEEKRVGNCAGASQLVTEADAILAPFSRWYKDSFASDVATVRANAAGILHLSGALAAPHPRRPPGRGVGQVSPPATARA